MPVFEGQCASKVLQSAPLYVEYSGVHLKCPCINVHRTRAISVEVGDGDPCSSKDTSVFNVLETMEAPKNTKERLLST